MAMGFNIGFHLSGQDFMNLLCKKGQGSYKNLLPTPFFPLFEGREIWPSWSKSTSERKESSTYRARNRRNVLRFHSRSSSL